MRKSLKLALCASLMFSVAAGIGGAAEAADPVSITLPQKMGSGETVEVYYRKGNPLTAPRVRSAEHKRETLLLKKGMFHVPDSSVPRPEFYHHFRLPEPVGGVEVEVHFRPSSGNQNPFSNARLQKFLESELENLVQTDAGFWSPSVRFALVMQLAHIQRHFLTSGIGLRQLLDYLVLLKHRLEQDRRCVDVDPALLARLARLALALQAPQGSWVPDGCPGFCGGQFRPVRQGAEPECRGLVGLQLGAPAEEFLFRPGGGLLDRGPLLETVCRLHSSPHPPAKDFYQGCDGAELSPVGKKLYCKWVAPWKRNFLDF